MTRATTLTAVAAAAAAVWAASLVPTYLRGMPALFRQGPSLALNLVEIGGLVIGAALVARGLTLPGVGVLIGLATGVLCLDARDVALLTRSGNSPGPGFWLGRVADALLIATAVIAVRRARSRPEPRWATSRQARGVACAGFVLGAILVVGLASSPYHLTARAEASSGTLSAITGGPFQHANTAQTAAASLLLVAAAVVPVIAALIRPRGLGAAVLGGWLVVAASDVVGAAVEMLRHHAASPLGFPGSTVHIGPAAGFVFRAVAVVVTVAYAVGAVAGAER